MGFTLIIKNKNMKKLTLIFALTLLSIKVKSQTTILKQEVDTAIINRIYSCYAVGIDGNIIAANQRAKKEFVNDMVIAYLRTKAKECHAAKAADKARKIAEDEIDTKPIIKVD